MESMIETMKNKDEIKIPNKRNVIPLLEKYKVDANNKNLHKLINLFHKSPNYLPWAIKIHFGPNNVSIDVLEEINNWATKHTDLIPNTSKKNLISFPGNEIGVLLNEMKFLEQNQIIQQNINKFNTRQREIMRKSHNFTFVDCNSSEFKDAYATFFAFNTLDDTHQRNIIKKVSGYNTWDEIKIGILDTLKGSYEWNKASLMNIITTFYKDDCEILFDEQNVLIAQIKSFSCIHHLAARTSWCIQEKAESFKSYVWGHYPPRTQFMLWDFNQPKSSDFSLIGFTYDPTMGLVKAHTLTNKDMKTMGYPAPNSYMIKNKQSGGNYIRMEDIFEHYGVNPNIFMQIEKPKFEWTLDGFKNILEKNNDETENIIFCDNNKILYKCYSHELMKILFSNFKNKWIYSHEMCWNINTKHMFVYIDFNKKFNENSAIYMFSTKTEAYGDEYITNTCGSTSEVTANVVSEALNNAKIPQNLYLKMHKGSPSMEFHKAVNNNDFETAKTILETYGDNVDINLQYNGQYPIFMVITNLNFALFKLLVSHHNYKGETYTDMVGATPLHALLYKLRKNTNVPNIYNQMLDYMKTLDNVNWDIADSNNDTPLHLSVEHPHMIKYAEFFISKGADVNKLNKNLTKPLRPIDKAINKQNSKAIDLLLKQPSLILSEDDIEGIKHYRLYNAQIQDSFNDMLKTRQIAPEINGSDEIKKQLDAFRNF